MIDFLFALFSPAPSDAIDDEAELDACLSRLERKARRIRIRRETDDAIARSDERIAASKLALGIPADEPIPAPCDWQAVRDAAQ